MVLDKLHKRRQGAPPHPSMEACNSTLLGVVAHDALELVEVDAVVTVKIKLVNHSGTE